LSRGEIAIKQNAGLEGRRFCLALACHSGARIKRESGISRRNFQIPGSRLRRAPE
jgi:hypothetical protein